jgi:phenylalanyl-tRNA synthetase beta chain
MIVSGHPTHAFDYDAFLKVGGTEFPDIKVRAANKGEKLQLLDDRTVELTDEDILIVSGDTPVGLAGAMGGAETEVTPDTKHIILESATFNLYNLRSTAMRHAVYSDAATRFTKGQPAAQTAPVLASALRMMTDIANGVRASEIVDNFPDKTDPVTVKVGIEHIHNVLGIEITLEEIVETLENAEFNVSPVSISKSPFPVLAVQVPFWRQDIHIPEDVIEEIGRLRGFDNIDPVLPDRPFTAVTPSGFDMFRNRVRQILVRGGCNEILTYNFVHESLLVRAGQDPTKAFKLTNAISPELQNFRMSLMPSLLDKVHSNIKNGFREFALFEMNKVHIRDINDPDEPDVPAEFQKLSLVFAADNKAALEYGGAPFYQAKLYLDFLSGQFGINLSIETLEGKLQEEPGNQLAQLFEPERSGVVMSDGKIIGLVGEFSRKVRDSFKLPDFTAGFELDIAGLYAVIADAKSAYRPLSRYPGTDQDICLRVADDITYQQVVDLIKRQLKKSDLEWYLEPVDIYKRPVDKDRKQITIRVHMTDHSKTITTEDANSVISEIAEAAKENLKAERV